MKQNGFSFEFFKERNIRMYVEKIPGGYKKNWLQWLPLEKKKLLKRQCREKKSIFQWIVPCIFKI